MLRPINYAEKIITEMFLSISHPKNDVFYIILFLWNFVMPCSVHKFQQVIGGGSGGLAAAKQAADLGVKAKDNT